MSWKTTFAGLAAAATMIMTVTASDFGAVPASYEDAASDYISERLADPRSARYRFAGEPYQVFADVSGYEGLPCWAVDVRVKARLPGGGYGGYIPYTVLFLNGEAVALEEDALRLVKA